MGKEGFKWGLIIGLILAGLAYLNTPVVSPAVQAIHSLFATIIVSNIILMPLLGGAIGGLFSKR